jgi:Lar family restriction alleviation protein
MEKLKGCPFCGGEARVFDWKTTFQTTLQIGNVICPNCYVSIEGDDAADAIAKWNRRANPVLRYWKAGSEPPDGVYISGYLSPIGITVENGRLTWGAGIEAWGYPYTNTLSEFLKDHASDCIYGPIPEPEVTEA